MITNKTANGLRRRDRSLRPLIAYVHEEPCRKPAWLFCNYLILWSDCDLLSAFAPACGKNLSAALGAHSGPEAVNLRALPFLRLICHFCHFRFLLKWKVRDCSQQPPYSSETARSVQLIFLWTVPHHDDSIRRLYILCLPRAAAADPESHIPSCVRKKNVPAAPARSCQRGYGCCPGTQGIPFLCKDANIRIIYNSHFCVKNYLSTRFPRQNVDKSDRPLISYRDSIQHVEKINFLKPNIVSTKLSTISHFSYFNNSTYPQNVHNLWISTDLLHIFSQKCWFYAGL